MFRNGVANARTTAIGSEAQAGVTEAGQTDATAVGYNARANVVNGLAVGSEAEAQAENSVALGQGAIADQANGLDRYGRG